MDGTKTPTNTATESATAGNGHRRRRETAIENARYFLPKPGSSTDKPELGQEMASEGEALVEAFKFGQVFYTLVAWKALPEMNGNEPKIVKQALSRR